MIPHPQVASTAKNPTTNSVTPNPLTFFFTTNVRIRSIMYAMNASASPAMNPAISCSNCVCCSCSCGLPNVGLSAMFPAKSANDTVLSAFSLRSLNSLHDQVNNISWKIFANPLVGHLQLIAVKQYPMLFAEDQSLLALRSLVYH